MGILKNIFKKKIPLVEAVELTSVSTFVHATSQVKDLISKGDFPEVLGTDPNGLNKSCWELILELVVFTLHLADRIAFNILGPTRRSKFVDSLLESVASNLSKSVLEDSSTEDQLAFQLRFLKIFNERTKFYGTLVLHNDDASMKGTLFWEAAKLSASRIFNNNSQAIFYLSIVFGSCSVSLGNLNENLQRLE